MRFRGFFRQQANKKSRVKAATFSPADSPKEEVLIWIIIKYRRTFYNSWAVKRTYRAVFSFHVFYFL
ncbi:hypothetical protein DT075_03770 [Bacillus licheniformis]|nr:hypothetical protein DT075_03770 [Bacillus licheniformis]